MPEADWEHDLIGRLTGSERAEFDRLVADIKAERDARRAARLAKFGHDTGAIA